MMRRLLAKFLFSASALRRSGAVVLFAVCACAYAQPAYAFPPNLIPTNPGAETGDFTGWTNDVDDPWMVDDSDPHGGTYDFVGGLGNSAITRDIDMLDAGYTQAQLDTFTNIRLTAWVKEFIFGVSADDQYGMLIALQGEGHGTMAFTYVSLTTVPADWTQIEASLGNYGPGLRYVHIELWSVDGDSDGPDQGAMFDDISLSLTGDSTAPTLSATTPVDNAVGVNMRTPLTMTFNEPVYEGPGFVVVRRVSDNAAVGAVDVTTDAVTGFGTATVTVTLPTSLPRNTAYYVTVDDDAFVDAWSNAYAGIATTTTWSFRTVGSSSVSFAPRSMNYNVTNATADIDDTGRVTVTWTAGEDVPYVRVRAHGEGIAEAFSPLLPTETFVWKLPDAYRNTPIAFTVEATDLATTLAQTETSTVTWTTLPAAETSADTRNEIPTVSTGVYVRTADASAVYFVTDSSVRRPVPNARTFFTWETSSDVVRVISDADMAALPLGAPLPPKPGTLLVKIQSIPKVYAVEGTMDAPVLRWIPTEALAATRYGNDWATHVMDIPPTDWARYSVGDDLR